VFNGNDILLMKRAAHRRIFPNRYNGVGGHIERDEDPFSGAKREIKEETGLDVHDLQLRAVHHIDAGEETGIMMFVFTATSDNRVLRDTGEEGTLRWVARDEILALNLVDDLPQLLPRILAMGKTDPPFFAHISYDASDTIQIRFAEDS
jgi:8-oxo-dGTP diphosphatase